VRIGILGPLEVERDGRRVEVGGSRLQALLARLAVDLGRPVSATTLADAIWEGIRPGMGCMPSSRWSPGCGGRSGTAG
jgi:DNA-binding SARP family transcriptional activator